MLTRTRRALRVEHGEFTVRTQDGTRVIDVQRGVVTTLSGQSITVKSEDGFSNTYTVDPNTKIRKDREDATINQIATNDRVVVIATTDLATHIHDHGPVRPA